MCDVLLAMPDATRRGSVLFGKNSDRPIDDCQVLHSSPRRDAGSEVRCSYVTVRDADPALATVGCRPYWCWGYEMGVNEAGVVGGNTAIYTRELRAREKSEPLGLTGMDLLRFGLERGTAARAAVGVITELLEEHGQWGSGVPGVSHDEGSYDNAFLVADAEEAWILETAGRRWVAERVTHGVRSISNEPTIQTTWTKASRDLVEHACRLDWSSSGGDDFNFALAYGDHEHYSRQVSHIRRMRSQELLLRTAKALDCRAMMDILRDHYEGTFLKGPQFHAFLPDFHTLCMHDSPSGFTWGNTATSLVVEIDPGRPNSPQVWACYLPPCSSAYFTCGVGTPLPDLVTATGTAGPEVRPAPSAPKDEYREDSLWWRFRRLIDLIRVNPTTRSEQVRDEFDAVEERFIEQAAAIPSEPEASRGEALQALTRGQVALIARILKRLESGWT
jgi:secernin